MINFIKSVLRTIRSIVLTAVLICLVIFMVNNREVATINFSPLPYNIETRVFLVMIAFFLLGMFFGFLAFSKNMLNNLASGFKTKNHIKKLEKQVAKK